tara:strand:- start:748 stop:1479 length:732 start_codon:yes stop_codon:yes gene_type:complete
MKKLFFFFIFFFSFSSLFSQQEVNQLDKNKKIINTDFPGFIKLNLGLNFLLENNEAMKMKAITSRSVGLNYSKPLFLSDNIAFNTGLGVEFENYSFKNNVIIDYRFDIDDNQINFIDSLSIDSDKTKLVNSLLELPLGIRYYFGDKENSANRFFVGIGFDLGLRINSYTKLKYTKNNKSIVNVSKNDFGLAKYRYSTSITFGNDNFNLFIKYFLSDFFQSGNSPEFIPNKPVLLKTGFSFSLF